MAESDSEETSGQPSRVWRAVEFATGVGVTGIAVGSVLGYLDPLYWLFGLFVHFRHVYLLGALVALPVLVVLRARGLLVAAAAVAVLNGVYVVPWYGGDAAEGCSGDRAVRVALANLNTSNRDYGAIRQFIERADPDVLVLLEYAAHFERELDGVLSTFDHRLTRRRRDNFGVAVFSDIPWRSADVVRPAGGVAPQVHAVLEASGGPVHLWAVHPLPPVKPAYVEQRDQLLGHLAQFTESTEASVVVAGDLNTTMWSPAYYALEEAGLVNARVGRGILGTWPSGFPIRLPIDHVTHTEEIETCGMQVGDALGSDHRPVVVDFQG